MVVLSAPTNENLSLINTRKTSDTFSSTGIFPVIDLSNPDAKTLIVEACQEFGFFKVVNHGVPVEFMARLEAEAVKFFYLSQPHKDMAGPPNPFGYGNKKIGPNGDVGWIEYLLFSTNSDFIAHKSLSIFHENPEIFWCAVNDYVMAVKRMVCEILELIADGLELKPRNVLSKLLVDENSDCCFRMNHYPPRQPLQSLNNRNAQQLIGFGEHTDPQIISAGRSNNASGLQICLRDGTSWVSVPPDPYSFFINVGDSLQVMTNGRFRSVRHRVVAESLTSRVSMIFFGGPVLDEKVAPLDSVMKEGEESLYKEFTWCEYKKSAYKTRLGDNRLRLFEKTADQ